MSGRGGGGRKTNMYKEAMFSTIDYTLNRNISILLAVNVIISKAFIFFILFKPPIIFFFFFNIVS